MNTPDANTVIGTNIKLLRERMGLTQEALAQYLGTSREQVAYYEAGSRTVNSTHLGRLANLFCIDEYDFYEDDPQSRKVNLAFAFRADCLAPTDLENIAGFKKIVRNYLHMKKLTSHG